MESATEGEQAQGWLSRTHVDLSADIADSLGREPDISEILELHGFTVETYIESAIIEHLSRMGATCQVK